MLRFKRQALKRHYIRNQMHKKGKENGRWLRLTALTPLARSACNRAELK